MSIVNLKIIFVKKQKQTRERPTQGGGGGGIIYNRNDRFHTRDGLFDSCEMGYPFDNSRQIGNTS